MNVGKALHRAPLAATLLAVLAAHLVGVLPQQTAWAELPADGSPLSALRRLTVAPNPLFSEQTGLAALGPDALWTAVFLLVLAALGSAVRAVAPERVRMLVLAALLPAFAPLAGLLALATVRLPELSFDPYTRGDAANRLLTDAAQSHGHTLLLGLVGAAVAGCLGLSALARHLAATEPRFTSEPVGWLRDQARLLLRSTGPALLALAGGAVVLLAFTAGLPVLLLDPLVRIWCGSAELPAPCAVQLSGDLDTLPSTSWSAQHPLLYRLLTLYAWQSFALLYVGGYVIVRRLTRSLPRVVGAAVSAYAAYPPAVCTYVALLDGVDTALDSGRQLLTGDELLLQALPPAGLYHALFAAPVAAAVCAGSLALRLRLRRAPADTADGEAQDGDGHTQDGDTRQGRHPSRTGDVPPLRS
ncbi:hypothetical protein [Streptomyces sp. Da 82-17]|uniref:hypothetical protein n=1 Tax=Streptomyces sp. Da 82-17 TaxID=3377116 RepID=UPI0038D36A81